jgi:hypothetical protein
MNKRYTYDEYEYNDDVEDEYEERKRFERHYRKERRDEKRKYWDKERFRENDFSRKR